MNYIGLFEKCVQAHASETALVDFSGERKMTYAELDALSGRVAGKLAALGIAAGDFVIVNTGRRAEYLAAYLGILKVGAAVVPVVNEYPVERIRYIRENCGAKLTITEDFFSDIVDYPKLCKPADGAAPALLVYTSGSTGTPKGILYTAEDLARTALRQTELLDGLSDIDFAAACMFSFIAHITEYLSVFLLGGCSHILPDAVRRSAEELADYYDAHKITAGVITTQLMRLFHNRSAALRRVITGSERVSQIYSDSFEIYNVYGMSELGHTGFFPIDRPYDNTPVGKAIGDLQILICDEAGNPLPDGSEGEIFLRGSFGMTYFRDERRTAQCMTPAGEGLTDFHTGDIGYIDENGDLVYVNRKDWMVKINGQRVETMEIETLLQAMPEVENAAVKAFADDDGQTYLAAYYVLSEPLTEQTLRTALRAKLPDYMIPRFFVPMDALPKNVNGKLDRKALLPPDAENYKQAYEAPATDAEKTLCEEFEKLLRCGTVGVNDDFFALGGDSIRAIRLASAANLAGITPQKILSGKTPRAIAALCAEDTAAAIPHGDVPAVCPLTDSQRGVYLECAAEPASLMYNIVALLSLPKGTDAAKFADAVRRVTAAHKAMSVTVSAPDGEPVMICRERDVDIPEKTVRDVSDEITAFVRPFDLENGPLYRYELLHAPDGDKLLMDVHHMIFDGTSLKAFLTEVADVYGGGEVMEEALTLFDVAACEKTLKMTDAYRAAQEFFREKLSGADCDTKPVSDVVDDIPPAGAGKISVTAAGLSRDAVGAFVKKNKTTEGAFFMGAFAYALAAFSGSRESFFTTASSGRHDPRLSSAVGMFVKTLPMHFTFADDMAVSDYLRTVHDDFHRAVENDCIAFGELAAEYGANTDISFIYQGELLSGAEIDCGRITLEMPETGAAQSDIDVMLMKTPSGYEVMSHFRRSAYSEGLVRNLVGTFLNVARGMLTAEKLADVRFTDAAGEAQLDRFNATEHGYDDSVTPVDLFRRQAAETPDAVCLVCNEKRMTYREVDDITDRLAAYLVSRGVGREKIVGVLIPRCEYMLLASLGVLKAGGAYLPLDPTYPPERLNLMVRDSAAMLLITTPELSGIIDGNFAGERMMTDDIPALPPCTEALPAPKPEDLFVMLYTSGSTGTPKGVMFEHSNALVTAEWVKRYFAMDASSRVAAYASYGFDANVFDMYPAVTSGAQLHIIADDIRLDFLALRKYFNDNGITHAVMTTQIGRQFALMGGLTSLRHLSVAGEKLTPLDPPDGFAMYNLYGPTEGSVVTSGFKIDKKYRDVPIGRAVDNLKMYVVSPDGRLLPVGGTGELWISGAHVTRGYLNRPEKTAEAYGKNPFTDEPGYERVYRTGDIVRLLPDGNLQFVGRRDGQVKVRGFRVELTEVEEMIRRFPGIKDATVAAFDEPSGGKFLAAYVVADGAVDTAALNAFIRTEKPPYMVPAVTMQIDKIPLNQNQKVNRKALPVPERRVEDALPPENDIQRKIFDVIAETVGHNAFGIDTDVYDAGLTSIGAVKLTVSLGKEFDVPVKIADIKENPTVRLLEAVLTAAKSGTEYEKQGDYPITKTQRGIFVECSADENGVTYNIPLLFRLGAGVDGERLASAVRAAINAHPYLKTKLFADANGDIRACRDDDAAPVVEHEKCTAVPSAEELVRPFSLLGGRLYRAAVYDTAEGTYLFLDIHHIISDGTSEAIILADIDRAYRGEELAPEKYSGFEAALDEEKAEHSGAFEKAKAYYDGVFAGCETECMPQKAPECAEESAGTVTKISALSPADVAQFCRADNVTENAFFNAAFGYALARFINRPDAVYATIHNGRGDSRLASAVTMLVRTVPVLATLESGARVRDYVRRIQDQLMDSMANDVCSFAEISSAYGITSDIIFAYQGGEFVFDTLCGEPAENIDIVPQTAKSPIAINVYLRDGKYKFVADYRRDMYSAALISSLLGSVEQTAAELMRCDTVGDIEFLSSDAKSIYAAMNATDTETEPTLCHEFIERHAAETPDAEAITAAGVTLTFAELDRRANVMANALIERGIGRGSIVGLVLDRTVEAVITELAIMKAGSAFLPMIPTYPDERIDYCLTNSEAPAVITSAAIKAKKPSLFATGKPYCTLTAEELLVGGDEKAPAPDITPDDLAYCIYTSGSTGTPKGVMITHANFSNFVQTDILPLDYFADETKSGAALNTSSISFDMSLYELYLALCTGRKTVMATEDEIHNPMLLRELMVKTDVRMMTATPSFLNNLISVPGFDDALANLKTLVAGAEAFPTALYGAIRAAAPGCQIVNGYGPTETTICSSVKELHDVNVTIGAPSGNVKYYVLDAVGRVQPPYAVGELLICGAGVSRGYIKLPEKTEACFVTFDGLPAYHSGDLVRLTADGEIAFGGRIDNQIKLRGFRVELDEIEKVMCAYPSVRQSKVLVRSNGTEDYLAGFFTATEQVDLDALTAHMKSRLTYYMVPAVMLQLDAMPLTPNGKIDKNGFPEVKQTARKSSGRRAAKKSLEQRLCEIFASVLSMDEVYADDNFFELGGTSLSASKVTMMLMSENIEVKYGDIFDNPTPELLAEFIEKRDAAVKAPDDEKREDTSKTHEALRWNMVKYAPEVTREGLGDVLLTGAVGFLGVHILRELIESEQGHIYCLVRRGVHETAEIRLKTMLVYYFSNGYDDALRDRITVIEADITDKSLAAALADIHFDTVINCAACVKHFSDSDILEQINVHGVENLIEICKARGAKLIQISTVSVPGIHTPETYEAQVRMHENELFVIDDMDNKYGISKYHAELRMFDAIAAGMRGKVIRVGNLMGRHSDGEFQANMETNMFLSGIRGFATMGKYPISHMTDPMSFSPVDCTARAVVLLAGTNDKFTAFNCNNRYGFDEMKIIDACNRNGITILPTPDEEYYAEFREKLGDDKVNARLTGLAAYDIPAHPVETDNLFTTNILYRIGFSWPLTDDTYLDRAIYSIMTLDYFEPEGDYDE